MQTGSGIRGLTRMALLAAALAIAGAGTASAQMPPWRSAETLKSEIYFGLRLADGKTVGEDDWNKFLSEIVMPRFPDGLTVIDAVGRSANAAKSVNPTKILVLVHPNVGDAPQRISEIKAEYRKRFGSTGVFHTDMPVRIAPAD